MFALVVFLIVAGADRPMILPVGPYNTLKACQTQLVEAKSTPWPDEVQAVGYSCIELKVIKNA